MTLTDQERLAAVKAWDEGYQQGVKDGRINASAPSIEWYGKEIESDRENPYKECKNDKK
jgi:hypothetical protein